MNMKLRRLAGYGPIAAFVSAGSLVVFLLLQLASTAIAAAMPSLLPAIAIAFALLQMIWIAGLAVAAIDLDVREHPSTSAGWLRSARVATLVALVMPIPIGIAPFTVGVPLQAPSFMLLFFGVATVLLVHNLVGRRTGLLRGALPWVGIATGALFFIAGLGYIGILLPSIGMTVFIVGFNVAVGAVLLYIGWAIWLGVKLSRSEVAAPASVASPAH